LGDGLISAQSASGMKGARVRARLMHGTGEPGAVMAREKSKRAAPVRVRVPKRGTGAEQSVMAMKVL